MTDAIAVKHEKYPFTDDMTEISGFSGGYEIACREMVQAGLDWLDAHPNADPQFHESGDNEDAKGLSKTIVNAVDDCTFAMHQAVIDTCLYVRKNGWDEYVAQMQKAKHAQ